MSCRSPIMLKDHRRVVTAFNWAPFDQNLLASCSMDTFVYKISNPVHYISTHDQRIHGLDWNPYNATQFAINLLHLAQGKSDSIQLLDNKVQYTPNSDNSERNTPDRGKIPLHEINNQAKSSESKDILINYKTNKYALWPNHHHNTLATSRMQIFIKNVVGETLTVNVDPSDSIQDSLEKLSQIDCSFEII
uniref:Uncharacterized protein n=1 Tax=Tetranychus urticae TaxID=32264 RepID=T1KPR7_TETUR